MAYLIPYAGAERRRISTVKWRKRNQHITKRQAEVLSYLQGLAPVGESLEVPYSWLITDLGFRNRSAVCNMLFQLLDRGFIRRLYASDWHGSIGVWVVLRRLETIKERV